jgi:hypothetical protein
LKKLISIFAVILFFLLIPIIVKSSSTQQYNKIYLNPFYTNSMSNGVNYTFNISVSPPDHISSVISAIISMDSFISPSVNFTILVNNKSCNTAYYYISTTYAGAGEARVTFDCSNIINKEGNYFIIIKPTLANTGASTIWLDLTYMNNPKGELKISGTEYYAGQMGKLFLQFLDADNNAVNNSECFLKLWYPNDTVVTNMNYTLMSKLENATDGIYYKNFIVPSIEGIYPASAKCYRPLTFNNIIQPNAVYEGWESNSFTGGIGWGYNPNATPPYGWDYYDASITNNATCLTPYGSYCVEYLGANGYIERGWISPEAVAIVNITFSHKFHGFTGGDTMEFWLWSGTWFRVAWYDITANSNDVWYRNTYTFTSNIYDLDEIYLSWYSSSTTGVNRKMYIDEINVTFIYPNITISNETEFQILRGSGEVHINPKILNISNVENVSYVANVGSVANANASFYDLRYAGGTEYSSNETAHLSFQFLKTSGGTPAPINDGQCNITVYFPNKTMWLNQSGMTYLSGSNGLYYLTITTPSTEGIYESDVYCQKGGINTYSASTFHISHWANTIFTIQKNVSDIFPYLSSMINSLDAIISNLTVVQNNLSSINSKLDIIRNDISNVNSTMLNEFSGIVSALGLISNQILGTNSSIFNKLYKIQDEISSVNDTLIAHNSSVFTKLYSIQDELATITLYLSNVTNITINETVDTKAGFTGLYLGLRNFIFSDVKASGDPTNAYCSDNSTLVQEMNVFLNDTWLNSSKDIVCPYGCDFQRNQCNEEPWIRNLWLIGVFVVVILLIIGILKLGGYW